MPKEEVWYAWKVLVDGEQGKTRLLVPHADPYEYEHPFDFIFASIGEAKAALKDFEVEEEAAEEGWILCRETITPVYRRQRRNT